MKISPLFIALIGLIACQNNTTKLEQTQQNTASVVQDKTAKTEARSTFFVTTSWATTDRAKAMANIQFQQKQLMMLFNKGLVENVYYNQKGQFADGQPLALVAFFLKDVTETEAHQALDTTDAVKSNLANYSLRKVGEQAFGRSEKAMKVVGTGVKTYAVVWAFQVKRNTVDPKLLSEQGKVVSALQKEGVIENGYIDLEHADGAQPAVYFVNAKNEAEARKILDAMPVVTAKQAVYGLHDVGQLMAGSKIE